jgi:uncharacterized protein YutE (UPF0331/DUF86 family)
MTKGRPDPEVIRRHLAALRDALGRLQALKDRTAFDLRANTELRWTVERGLQLCTQNVLDIATHVAAASGLDAPDYASAIDRLADLDIVNAAFAARLRPLAGFRNVLVHGYLDVDLAIVEQILREGLPQLEAFAASVEAYLSGQR